MTRTTRKLWPLLLLGALVACNEEKVCSSADQRVCDGTCVATASDVQNCGTCGHACAAGETCSAGLCICPADGRADCDGSCVDVKSDPANCGACGIACSDGQVCTTGGTGETACAASCALETQTACDAACVDTTSDRWNCGACGRTCGTNERCDAGRCAADLYLACYNSNDVRGATRELASAGSPMGTGLGTGYLGWLGPDLYVASAGSEMGSGQETLSRISFGAPEIRVDHLRQVGVSYADYEALAAHGGLLYVSHASAGTLLIVKPDGSTVEELRLSPVSAPLANPQGIAFVGDKAYVALNARDEVIVLDVSGAAECAAGTRSPPCLSELRRIDLSGLASTGASAQPSRLAVVGDRLFVTLWNLGSDFKPPAGSTGRVAVIDTASDSLDVTVSSGGKSGLVDLGAACLDPADVAAQGSTLYVTCGAFVGASIVGAGVAVVELGSGVPVAGPVLPAAGGSAPGALAFCGGAGYVGDRNSGKVFSLDPTAGALEGVELCPPSGGWNFVSDVACGF
jgi:hypothetical protein